MSASLAEVFTPALPRAVTWQGVSFSLRTTVASLTALYIAFLLNLDDPKWAAMTVWIVAQATRGESLSKGKYRILGTFAGAIAGISLIALFAQTPELFVPGIAAWLAVCTAIATRLRNFRAYGAVLAGYSALIIAFDAIHTPLEVFDIAVARVTYICIGIGVEGIFTAILAPDAPMRDMRPRLLAFMKRATAVSAQALGSHAASSDIRQIYAEAFSLETAGHFAFQQGQVRRRLGHLRAAFVTAMRQMAAAQALGRHLTSHPAIDEPLVAQSIALIEIASDTGPDPGSLATLRKRVDGAFVQGSHTPHPPLDYLLVLDRLRAVIDDTAELHTDIAAFFVGRSAGPRVALATHIDRTAALHNAIRAFLGVALASIFWIFTAWPSGIGFVVILGVVCALYATRPDPIAGAMGFLKGGFVAVISAGICNFAILPGFSDFVPLAMVLGLPMVLGGLAIRHVRFTGPATSFAFLFLDLVSPDNTSRADPATFLNGSLAMLMGVATSVVIFVLIIPPNPPARRRRLLSILRRDLQDMGKSARRWSVESWTTRMADRLSLLAATDTYVSPRRAEEDFHALLATLTVGAAVIRLDQMAAMHHELRRPWQVVCRRLSEGNAEALAHACDRAALYVLAKRRLALGATDRTLIDAAIRLHEIGELAKVTLAREHTI